MGFMRKAEVNEFCNTGHTNHSFGLFSIQSIVDNFQDVQPWLVKFYTIQCFFFMCVFTAPAVAPVQGHSGMGHGHLGARPG